MQESSKSASMTMGVKNSYRLCEFEKNEKWHEHETEAILANNNNRVL